MGSQRIKHNLVTKQQQAATVYKYYIYAYIYRYVHMCTSMFTYIHISHTTYIDSGSILKGKPLLLKVLTADLGEPGVTDDF